MRALDPVWPELPGGNLFPHADVETEPHVTHKFDFADEIKNACRYCATIARAKIEGNLRGFATQPTDYTATVTFIKFDGQTYAVTAAHVVDGFARQAALDRFRILEGYYLPAGPGGLLNPPLVRPPPNLPEDPPDVALRSVDEDFPTRIGKEAFVWHRDASPTFPIAYAAAIGFPTIAKKHRKDPDGNRLELPCVRAVVAGIGGTENTDQLQFFSEIEVEDKNAISSLSGMSGGPVFWSDGERLGLLGFVKEALPPPGADAISGPRVSFICQRATFDTFGGWVEYVNGEWPKRRAALAETAKKL